MHLFGQMRAVDASGNSVLPRGRKARAILAVLALAEAQPVLRTRLIGLLWSRRDKPQAHASLRQCVHELRSTLGPSTERLLEVARSHVRLIDRSVWIDARAVLAATSDAPQALGLFRQTLLEDLTGVDAAFDRWLREQQTSIMQRARLVAEAVLAARADPRGIAIAAEQLLLVDGAHEGAWRSLIQAHLDQGNRAAALASYQRCLGSLREVGLIPSSDIQELVHETIVRPYEFLPARSAMPSDSQQRRNAGGVRLAVLPFRKLDGSAADALSLGLADEMTTALLRFRWISCIEPEVADAVALRQLDVDYILGGSIRQSSNRIRVTVKLLDMSSDGKIVWIRHFDRYIADVLNLQNDIASAAAAQIDPELLLRAAERPRPSSGAEPASYDLIAQAVPAIYRLEPQGFRQAGDTLAGAVAADLGNAAAYAWWAYWHLLLVGQGWAAEPLEAIRRAGQLADRAVTLDPDDARALTLVGHVRGFLDKRPSQALVLHERALSLNPNLALAWCLSGLSSSYLGEHDVAIRQIEQARRLSPNDPHSFFFDMALMMPHFLSGNYEEVATIGRRAIELNPVCSSSYKGYLATLGFLGREQEARLVRTRLLTLEPGFSVQNAVERSPIMRRDDRALYAEGLRRGGLPEL